MGCGSSKTTTASTTTAPPPQYSQAYSQLQSQAAQTAAQPLQQYQGNIVAGFSPDQQSAFSGINAAQGAAQPYLNQASANLNAATAPLWANTTQYSPQAAAQYTPTAQQYSQGISQYQSPYTQQVVDATQAQFNNQNAQQFNQANGSAAAAGAFGGDRSAVLQAQLAGQQQAAQAPVIAGLYNQGYANAQNEFNTQQQTGLSEFNTQQQQQLAANEANAYLNSQSGFGQMQLAQEAQNLPLSAASAQLQSGGLQQQLAQEQLNVPYEQFQQQQAYPFQTESWLSGIDTGLGSLAGGTSDSSQTEPGASPLSQILGLGMSAASLIPGLQKGGGIKNNVVPFRKRDSGGMIPYQPISLSANVPDVSTSYVPGAGSSSGSHGSSLPTSPIKSSPQSSGIDPAFSQGVGMLSKSLQPSADGINPVVITPNQMTGLGGSGGIFDTGQTSLGGALGSLGSGAMNWLSNLKDGGMVPKRRAAGGSAGMGGDDDDIEPVTMTQENPGITHTGVLGNNFGFAPVTPAVAQPASPDWRQALLAAGLATMSGGSHNALENVGAGGLSGLANWNAQKTANMNQADKAATLQQENNRTTISQQEAQAQAAARLDDMDQRRVQEMNHQSNTDRSFYQTQKNEDAQRKIQQQEFGLRQQEINNTNAGSWVYQGTDPVSGNIVEINSKTGEPRVVNATIGAKPSAGGAGGGGRYAAIVTRSLTAAKDATSDLENMVNLPDNSNAGWFGMRGAHGDGSLTGSTFNVMGNELSPQRVQDMNTTMVGLGRALAGLETGGMQVQQALMAQYEKLAVQQGDTSATALRKLGTMRQNALNGIESNMASPYISADQKAQFTDAESRIKKAIPWTPADVTAYERAAEKNPGLTFGDYAKQNKVGQDRDVTPPMPHGVPAGSAYSPTLNQWRDAHGRFYNSNGQALN